MGILSNIGMKIMGFHFYQSLIEHYVVILQHKKGLMFNTEEHTSSSADPSRHQDPDKPQ